MAGERAPGTTEIEIVEFKEDPGHDCALSVSMDIRAPQNRYEMLTVFFTELFIQQYFSIPWNKDIVEEQRKISRNKRDLLIRWCVLKAEQYLKGQITGERIMVDFETDGVWAKKVEDGLIAPASRPKTGQIFVYR